MAVPLAPAACSACARWMSTLPVRPHLVWCWGGAPVSALGVLWPQGPISSSLFADSATAFGAQTSHLPQMQPPVTQAGVAAGPCCCAGMGGAPGCGRR